MDSSSTVQGDSMCAPKPDVHGQHEAEFLLEQISDIERRIKQIEKGLTCPASISPSIRVKLEALRKLQLQIIEKEAKFHLMAHTMEVEFQNEFNEAHDSIARIVNGLELLPELLAECEASTSDVADQPKGVPDFWLTVLKSSFLDFLIQDTDEPALKALTDIRCVLQGEPEPGFLLEFHFAPNDYFTNEVLTKQYFLQCKPSPEAPSKFNGFEIYHCVGCTIDWKPGHNLNEKPVPATDDEATRIESSFFNFFQPEAYACADFDPDYNVALMECDFQHGYYIKETVIPRAVFLFLGENVSASESCCNCCCDRCLNGEERLEEVERIATEATENEMAQASGDLV